MPTLAFDGSVIYSTAVDRREIVYIAPSYTVEVLSTHAQTSVAAGNSHTFDFANHPNGQATNFMLSLSEGDVDVAITNSSGTITYANVTPSGMLILMNVIIDQVVITANADSVYDMIAGG
jgi:hypothetical protein